MGGSMPHQTPVSAEYALACSRQEQQRLIARSRFHGVPMARREAGLRSGMRASEGACGAGRVRSGLRLAAVRAVATPPPTGAWARDPE
jgi:hypothetical protein